MIPHPPAPAPVPPVELRVLDPRLHDWGLPRPQTAMAAAVDLFACLDAPLDLGAQDAAVLVPSGLAIHIADPQLAAMILPRSGLGHRGLVLGNGIGLIDADYTGQIMISLWNRNPPGSAPITLRPGDRVAQMLFVPVVRPLMQVVQTFSRDSGRTGGFGSTGV
ncbi:dUTP diphosphatase [Paracoccus endophyticus]|uniref:dUTP diphosphatase n=1 Tax=Paracoccus endophyticus TaxID=2233774 RepID=UPI000DDA3121|nr:dUTP diphosphatase [Paracoccus endophyticus]